MSHLSIFSGSETVAEEPQIYSFLKYADQHRQTIEDTFEVVTLKIDERARTEHQNRCCPSCDRITVEPVELRDGQRGRNGAIIRGTGTLVGFRCNACGHEWPIAGQTKRITM